MARKAPGRKRSAGRGARAVPGRLEAEMVALVLATTAIFLEVSLFSYDAADPWWGFGTRVSNLCGPVGALLAAGLAGSFGWAAQAVPVAALVIALRYLLGRPLRARWIPVLGWSVFGLALAGFFEVLHQAWPARIPADAGGVAGSVTVRALSAAVYLPGSVLLLGIALIASFLVSTGLALRDGLRWLQRGLASALAHLAGGAASLGRLARGPAGRLVAQLRLRGQAIRPTVRNEGVRPARPAPAPPAGEPEVVEHRAELRTPARQVALPFERGGSGVLQPFEFPDLELLAKGVDEAADFSRDQLITNSRILEKKLADFGVSGRVVKVHPGPVITMYEFEPAAGIKLSKIVGLADDLALALRALSVRIVAPIPGKSVVGVEVPNVDREVVALRDLLMHASYQESDSKLTIALGKDIFGTPVVTDLARMPHLLVAGATGTGKSVFLNALLCSLFYGASPDQVKFLLIDPKLLEFSCYEGIPHLLSEVVTNPKRAAAALMGVVSKMEDRYRLMADRGVRNIDQYNKSVARERAQGRGRPEREEPPRPLPYIVVIIDELADLMIVSSRDVEESLTRLAQMARAAGIHLVLATQRPSVDVLTGIIKANFPSRISFQVSSRTDSRTVLDGNGAERLLGMGDMLFLPPGTSQLQRIHAPYVSEAEVERVADYLRSQGTPDFDPTIIRMHEEIDRKEERGEEFDAMYDAAVDVVARSRISSISFIQRKLKVGYNRAARLVEQMELEGVVGPQEGTKPREIFVPPV